MNINQAVSLNMSTDIAPPTLHMAQGDTNSRTIVATLYDGSQSFTIPADSVCMVRFGKPDGTGGLYDHTESGAAVTYLDNVVTAPVASQMLSVSGTVKAEIDVYKSGGSDESAVKLASFCFLVDVHKSAYSDDTIVSSDYYNIVAAQIAAAIEAGEKADAAIAAADNAIQAANTAVTAKDTAVSARDDAVSAKTTATNAANLAESAKTAAESAKTAAENAQSSAAESASAAQDFASNAEEDAQNAAQDASDAEAWAVGQRNGVDVPSTDPAYHNNAKYYKDQAGAIAGGGVTSFNGRGGDVEPQPGDYTKDMVGLGNVDNTSDANKPVSNAQQAALNEKQSKITASGLLKGDGSGGVSKAVVGSDYAGASTSVNVIILADGWSGDSAPYTYSATVEGVTETSVQDWTNNPNITLEQLEAWQAANVVDAGQSANTVIFKAFGDKPAVDIPLKCILRKDM